MNFRDAMIQEMTSLGMFRDSARQVIDMYIANNENAEMESRWFDKITDYPEGMVVIVWVGVKEAAAKWIEKYAPNAWYRPMFQYSNKELQQMMKQIVE